MLFPQGLQTTNNVYGHYTDYSTVRLPESPRALKNRYIDRERQRLTTTNETYGRYWSASGSPASRPSIDAYTDQPAGLASRRSDRRLPHPAVESVDSFWNPDMPEDHPLEGPAGHPSGFADRPEYPWNATQEQDQQRDNGYATSWTLPTRMLRPLPPISSDGISSRPLFDGYGVNVAGSEAGQAARELEQCARQFKVSIGLNDPRLRHSQRDIRHIDLHIKLRDNSTVTIKSVPYSY